MKGGVEFNKFVAGQFEKGVKHGRVNELNKFIEWARNESEDWAFDLESYAVQNYLSKRIKEIEKMKEN